MPCVYFTFSPDAFHIYVIQINLIIYVYKNNNFKYSVLISLTMMMNMKGFFFLQLNLFSTKNDRVLFF